LDRPALAGVVAELIALESPNAIRAARTAAANLRRVIALPFEVIDIFPLPLFRSH
jgi:hypothetical protein